MELEIFRFDMVRRFHNLIFNIIASLFSILGFRYRVNEPFRWKLTCKTKQIMRILLKHGIRLMNSLIDTVLTINFGQDIAILKMPVYNKVEYIEVGKLQVGVVKMQSFCRGRHMYYSLMKWQCRQ